MKTVGKYFLTNEAGDSPRLTELVGQLLGLIKKSIDEIQNDSAFLGENGKAVPAKCPAFVTPALALTGPGFTIASSLDPTIGIALIANLVDEATADDTSQLNDTAHPSCVALISAAAEIKRIAAES